MIRRAAINDVGTAYFVVSPAYSQFMMRGFIAQMMRRGDIADIFVAATAPLGVITVKLRADDKRCHYRVMALRHY